MSAAQLEFLGVRRVSDTRVVISPIAPGAKPTKPAAPRVPAVASPEHHSDPSALADRMLAYLEAAGGWRTREEVGLDTGLTERECRLARQHSKGRIVFGQLGFRATEHATLEEIRYCASACRSQAREMLRQSIALLKAAHARLGG